MRQLIFIISIIALAFGCSTQSKNQAKELPTIDQEQPPLTNSASKEKWIYEDWTDCDIDYDTIADEKYVMHHLILEKFNNKEKRGYIFSSEGDTVNNFLYTKDISEFIYLMNTEEEGIHKMLTNKVVFLILEEEPKLLEHGLTIWNQKENDLDYFMAHVSNPFCNKIPIDSIIKTIEKNMGTSNERAIKVKEIILLNLEQSKL